MRIGTSPSESRVKLKLNWDQVKTLAQRLLLRSSRWGSESEESESALQEEVGWVEAIRRWAVEGATPDVDLRPLIRALSRVRGRVGAIQDEEMRIGMAKTLTETIRTLGEVAERLAG